MPKRRGRRWVPVLTALGCAVLTAVCTVGAVAQASVDTSSVPVYSLPPAPRPPEPLALPAQPRVLLVGDSYSEGYGAEPVSEGFAFHVAGPLGWSLTRDGIGSTGYLNPGPRHQGTFRERLLRHPRGPTTSSSSRAAATTRSGRRQRSRRPSPRRCGSSTSATRRRSCC